MLPAINNMLSGRFAYVWGTATLHESDDLTTLVRLIARYLCDEEESRSIGPDLSEHSIRDQSTGRTIVTFHRVPGDFWNPVLYVRFREQSYFYDRSEENLFTRTLFSILSEV